MLKTKKRVLTFSECLSSILTGKIVPSQYDFEESGGTITYKKKLPTWSKLEKSVTSDMSTIVATTKPTGINITEWIQDCLHLRHGVLAALPGHDKFVSLSQAICCGHSSVWLKMCLESEHLFNHSKARRMGSSTSFFEANTLLESTVLPFVPVASVYNLNTSAIDSLVEAGIVVEVNSRPYISDSIEFIDPEKQLHLCAEEIAFKLTQAKRSVAPAVFAIFYGRCGQHVDTPLAASPLCAAPPELHQVEESGDINSIITVTQIHTFSLSDLMQEISYSTGSKRDHLINVLKQMSPSIFETISNLTQVDEGRCHVKLNLAPDSIVFCPQLELDEESDAWVLLGHGFNPITENYLDGQPKLINFDARFQMRLPAESYSPEASFVMHSLLLISFTRALHGSVNACVLRDFILKDEKFNTAVSKIQSQNVNLGGFLCCTAAFATAKGNAELARAVAEMVADLDTLVGKQCTLLNDPNSSGGVFTSLICLLSGLQFADTNIFLPVEEDDTEQKHELALRALKGE